MPENQPPRVCGNCNAHTIELMEAFADDGQARHVVWCPICGTAFVRTGPDAWDWNIPQISAIEIDQRCNAPAGAGHACDAALCKWCERPMPIIVPRCRQGCAGKCTGCGLLLDGASPHLAEQLCVGCKRGREPPAGRPYTQPNVPPANAGE